MYGEVVIEGNCCIVGFFLNKVLSCCEGFKELWFGYYFKGCVCGWVEGDILCMYCIIVFGLV